MSDRRDLGLYSPVRKAAAEEYDHPPDAERQKEHHSPSQDPRGTA